MYREVNPNPFSIRFATRTDHLLHGAKKSSNNWLNPSHNFSYICNVKNLSVTIGDSEYSKLGLPSKISFAELKEKISLLFAKEALLKCQRIARTEGLSKITLDEINAEIKAVRRDAKNRD